MLPILGQCSGCRWWYIEDEDQRDSSECEMMRSNGKSNRSFGSTLAHAVSSTFVCDENGEYKDMLAVYTSRFFGCVMFEQRTTP